MNTEEKAELMLAFDRKEIEIEEMEWNVSSWEQVYNPGWDWVSFDYREKVKENPMQKYIELDLDMGFSDTDKFATEYFDKLSHILNKTYNYKSPINGNFKNCRLRHNHVHWWGNKSKVNPIPKGCKFRVYTLDEEGWSSWYSKISDTIFECNKVLAFEIRYL